MSTETIASKYAGADWLQEQFQYVPELKGRTLSPLAVRVADILGQAFAGIYHISNIVRQKWFEPWGVGVVLSRGELATYDGSELSGLVILCHDAAIRLSVSVKMVPWDAEGEYGKEVERLRKAVLPHCDPDDLVGSPRLYLQFHQRSHAGKRLGERHPTLEQSIETWRRLGAAIKGRA